MIRFPWLRPRWHKVVRDLFHHKARTALVVLSIAIGVMGIGVISGAQTILARETQAAYLATNPHHAVLYTEPFGSELVQVIEGMAAVAAATGRRAVDVRLQVGDGEADAWQELQLIALADFDDLQIDRFTHLAGAWPPPKRTLLLERASLQRLGLAVGETVQIQLSDGDMRAMEIAGTVHDINQVPTLFSGEVQGFITLNTLALLGWPTTFDELYITVTGDQFNRTHILDVTQQVKEKVERSGRAVYGEFVPVPGEHWSHNTVASMVLILRILGILALFLSGFLVINTISAVLLEQIRQIGVMKAVGARRSQLVRLYLGTVVAYGLLALLVAVPLGILATVALTAYAASLLNFDLSAWAMPLHVLLLEAAVGLLVPMLAALYPILAGTRLTVREAIHSYGLGQSTFGSGLIDRLLGYLRGLSRPVLLALRNTFRRKGRLVLVLITLTLASAIFIGVLSVQASLQRTLDDSLRYWQYDVNLSFGRPYRTELLDYELRKIPAVIAAESWGIAVVTRMRSAEEQSDNVLMIAPPADTQFIDPIVIEGRWLLPTDENAVVINTDLRQDEPDLAVGDELVLRIDERESTWRIVGLIRQPLSGPFLYVNFADYEEETRLIGRVRDIRVKTVQHDARTQAAVAQQLEAHFEREGFQVSSSGTTAQERAETESSLNIIVLFLLMMAVLLALVGGLGLTGVMSINVLERTREIGVMRAIGATNWAVMQIVIVEGVVIGLLSWSMGALLAWPLGQLMSDQVGLLFLGTRASYRFSEQGALFWLGAMIGIATVATLLPARNAARLTVHEALAYQ